MTGRPLVIAHRGDSRHAPENTLAAIQLAVDAGADGIEIDLRLARDGVPVVIHDADLVRTAGMRREISDLTSAELAGIDVGSWFNRKFPRRSSRSFADQTVPSLDDLLKLVSSYEGLLYLELKSDVRSREQLVSAICKCIKDRPLLPNIIVKSFDLKAIALVKQVLPAVQTAALFGIEARILFKRRRHIIDVARQHAADQLSIHRLLATRSLTQAATEAAMPVTVWTVDDPRWLSRAQRSGITALITNDPVSMLARMSHHRHGT